MARQRTGSVLGSCGVKYALWLVAFILVWPLHARAAEDVVNACTPQIVAIQAARADPETPEIRPVQGWVDVKVPEVWFRRWLGWGGSVWYRIDWKRAAESVCEDSTSPVALGIDGIMVAGEVFSNNDLLWRDASLVEPLSRSWNVPRWGILPASSLHTGINSVWVRAVGAIGVSSGLGPVRLGEVHDVAEKYNSALWRQRLVYFINAVLCTMAAALFLLVWAVGRRGRSQAQGTDINAYGWFGLMALCWLAYLTTYLAPSPWPWPDSLARARFSQVALIGYALCVCIFTFRFGGQHFPRIEKILYGLAALGTAVLALLPHEAVMHWLNPLWQATMWVILLNGLQFQWHAWRPRQGRIHVSHRLLAVCWLVFVVVGVATQLSFVDMWQVARYWAALSGLSVIGLVMLLLGAQLVRQMRSMALFNRSLEERVAQARNELEQAQGRAHAQALENAKLQERMRIAHDLHDGLGASLVRGMALVEQAGQTLPNDRVLSLFKTLRDDLRQVIDYGSSAGATVPDTPVQWVAPLRHRFTHILDELDVASEWNISPQWPAPYLPSALQCLGLTRLMEEALSNVIKHSHARHLRVAIETGIATPRQEGVLVVRIEDDGTGFDVAAVRQAGLSVGMRSMAARSERIGAQLQVTSSPCGTMVSVLMVLAVAPASAAKT
ncbi:histidine kinase [Lampropedia puyangensis]|uniref:Histidine kinase n=1 Tax=Lampropedia puyangensis TaxID=1330072 RepID=A0A4S8FB45_9BURK|nr:ATP-binding protein [Lampropedia puyangensis]THU02822.1 histidine kinase [Lampropedia puyangensis]